MKLPWQAELPLWPGVSGGPREGILAGEARRIALGERVVHYTLRRARRRTIGLTIDHRGLRVGAPLRASVADVEALLRKHGLWVIEKLDAWSDRPLIAATPIVDGAVFPLLGQPAQMRIGPGKNSYLWHLPGPSSTDTPCLELLFNDPAAATGLVERALRARAHAIFADRMADFCIRHGIVPPLLRLSSARTRWGSCSRSGGIRLNWRLVHAPLDLVDYVLAHELAHLREMNHTPRFWSEVERLYTDWRGARQQLRRFGEKVPSFVEAATGET